MNGREFIKLNMGRLTKEQASNIAREIRYLWRYLETVYPNGDKQSRAQLRVTIDRYGQYNFYLNHQAMKLILFYAKDIPGPMRKDKQTTTPVCPPEVPDFLRWDGPRSTEG